jgi:hypothetical protein
VVFLAHPRTASNAVGNALRQVGFRKDLPGDHHGPLTDEILSSRDKWLVFTVIRNHWDAVASWMFVKPYPMLPPWELEHVKDFTARSRWIRGDGRRLWFFKPDADVVIEYAHLEEQLDVMFSSRDVEWSGLEKTNVGKERNGRHYHGMFTKEAAEYIGDFFADEIAECGYVY